VKKNFLYYLLPSIIIGSASAFIMVPITTYYLDPKDFGVAAIMNAITMPLGPLSSTGVAWVLSAYYYKIDDAERKIMLFNLLVFDLVLRLFWVVLFWLLAPTLLPVIVKDFQPQYLFFFSLNLITFLLMTFWTSISALIILQQRGSVHALFEVCQWSVGAVTTVVCLVIFRLSTVTLFVGPIFSGIFSFIAGLVYVRKYVTPKMKVKWVSEIVKVGIPSIPTDVADIAKNISDRYFIQRWLNLSLLGIYSHSQSYKNVFLMGGRAFNRTIGPLALEIFSKGADPQRLHRDLKKWYGLLCIGGAFVTFFSHEVVNILTHGKFIAAAPLVPVWYLMLLSFAYGNPYTYFLLAHKRNLFLMYSGIVISVVFVAVTAFSVLQFGIFGATVAIVLSNFAIQASKHIYAKMLGCPTVGDKYFFSAMTLMIATYVAVSFIPLNIYEKAVGFVAVAGIAAWIYGVIDVIISNWHRFWGALRKSP
jgi:O-antigen/teichoic acid export membrane protein